MNEKKKKKNIKKIRFAFILNLLLKFFLFLLQTSDKCTGQMIFLSALENFLYVSNLKAHHERNKLTTKK